MSRWLAENWVGVAVMVVLASAWDHISGDAEEGLIRSAQI